MSDLQYVDIYFADYRPDLGGAPSAEMPGYLTDAVGVRITPNGYRGLPTFADLATSGPVGTSNNLMQAWGVNTSSSRNFFVLNNSDSKIFETVNDGSSWFDVTPAAGVAITFQADLFTFDLDVIIVQQARAAVSKALLAGPGTAFTNLAGSPPIAVCGARVRDHVVLGGLIGINNYAIQTSAIGVDNDWPTPGTADAQSKQSIRETLPQELGIVSKILGGEKIGIVVQETGLTRMTYEGGDTVYSFDTFESSIGAGRISSTPPMFTTDGKFWYWINEQGAFATDGYSVNRLDDGSIQDAIFNDLLSHPNGSVNLIVNGFAAYDPHRHLAIFGSSANNYQLCLDVSSRSFSWMNETNARWIFSGVTDSTTKKISGRTLHNINKTSRVLQQLNSNGATVAMQTGYIEIDPGYTVQFQGAHLLGAGTPGSLAIAYKAAANYAACDVSQSGFTTLTANTRGMKSTGRSSSQFFSFRITGTGSEAQLIRGIRVFFTRDVPSQ